MKLFYALLAALMLSPFGFAQEQSETETEIESEEKLDPDTTRINLGKTTLIFIENNGVGDEEDGLPWTEERIEEEEKKSKHSEAHWAGVDLGVGILMDANMDNNFTDHPYWKNDIAKSLVFNLNVYEHKFNFGTPFVGLTTGLGFSFTSVGFNDNYLLTTNADTLFAEIDTVNSYSKNKLKASYLTVPLMLEFMTNRDEGKSFYLAAGVVGGVRIASKTKRVGEFEGKEFKEKVKGTYALNPFKLDAAVRLGYGNFGAFANYSLLPLFDTKKTLEVYPLTFGLSLNF
ncbi:MAG: hypothetical protein ACI837_001282 [Crocinitomicaceae bacterium]|jgi:hypothetical protein